MKTLDQEQEDRLRVVRDRHSVGQTYNKLVLKIKAEAIAEVIRAFTPETPISVLQQYHDRLINDIKEK